MKKKCIKCKKFGQIFTCNGCQESYCDQHIAEHREELSRKMNDIDKDYHHFQEDLNENEIIQTYLSRIDQWELDSMNKIRKTAEAARHDLSKMFDRMKNRLKTTCNEIHVDIESKQREKHYSEIHLNKWIEQLEQLRNIHKTSFTDDIINETQSSIQLIKIVDRNESFSIDEFHSYPPEKFDKIVGKIILSDGQRTAKCSGRKWNGSDVSGKNLYSFGVHTIRFRVKINGRNNPFFGITSSVTALNPYNHKTPYAYGWWELPFDKNEPDKSKDQSIRTDDELTLTLDCINSQIQFEHHRTKKIVYESISHELCPFPWKVAIVLYSPGDSVSILS
ncbi:unnamed protein product [Rotaria magnacalcarata]|uniref:Uncharacterized protein n=2 Tax=Rotaria magnacalcarata TaxID=392030 RepID=A0A820KWP6_9BILA|nr:unnamed protein product [Rotaria magnacalcarata]CAF1554898.1 unnamed protein product [Rotaria magnacalcarata]CAF1986323.1 unnamed protein product [Rotaria magnacalcarata]CAF2142485.1 unnamed protein product [Rotaria magnacalcarata]CAF4306483.1 unnamed protein product [Rotaria magnacalcarata]